MKKFIICLLIGLQISCISADPKMTESNISNETFKWNYEKPIIYERENSVITIYLSDISGNIFSDIYYKYVVDGDVSALKYLSENYDICLINVFNKKKSAIEFDLTKLKLLKNNKSYKFISPLDIPSKVKRINPKGITKNVYNTVVIIAITAAVIALCKDSKSPPVFPTSTNFSTNSSSGVQNDYEANGIFSNFFHKTKYKFNDCILDANTIPSLSNKSGIVFIKKGRLSNGNIKFADE